MTDERDVDPSPGPPDPAWRGALGRRLAAVPPPPGRPVGLARWIGGLCVAGSALLLVALTQM